MTVRLFEDPKTPGAVPWWVEGGDGVWHDGERLHVKADTKGKPGGNVCTVWADHEFEGDFRIEYDVQVTASSIDANNINLFFCYSSPDGIPLKESAPGREDSAYGHYHKLNGYIITFLNDFQNAHEPHPDGTPHARLRMRRCPGFHLIKETCKGRCQQGETYHVGVTRKGGEIAMDVDGEPYIAATDPDPLPGGLIGLRTFHSELWWADFTVTPL
jgi:hypothetical protein